MSDILSSTAKTFANPRKFRGGERLKEIIRSTSKYVLVSSPLGVGDTADIEKLQPSALGVEKLVYVTPDNPYNLKSRAGAFEDWEMLIARHGGVYRDRKGNLRRITKQGKTPEILPNCARADLVGIISDAGLPPSKENICQGCSYLDSCGEGVGQYNYLGERRRVLGCDRFIANYNALPNAICNGSDPSEAYDYSQTCLLIDVDRNYLKNSRQVEACLADLEQTFTLVGIKAFEEFEKLRSFLINLCHLLKGDIEPPNKRYGWNHHELVEQLGQLVPEEINFEALQKALEPNQYEVVKQWLIPMLRVFKGEPGCLLLRHGRLKIVTVDERLVDICRAAKKVIFLDATGDINELAALLDVSPDAIDWVEQETPQGADLTITQVTDLGKMGRQRGEEKERRGKALVKHIKETRDHVAVIRFKDRAEDDDYHWFVDSRGSNDMQDCTTLVLDGLPCPNLEQLRAEFACLYRSSPPTDDDERFKRFIHRRIEDEVIRLIEQLKANRQPGEKLEAIILTNFSFLRLQTHKIKASEITLKAAAKTEYWQWAIAGAVKRLKAEGRREISQSAVARFVGCSPQLISRDYKDFLIEQIANSLETKA